MVLCSELFDGLKKILKEKAKIPEDPVINEGATVEEQPSAQFQFNLSVSKSGERLVS